MAGLGRVEIVKLLLKQKVIDINAKSNVYLCYSMFYNGIWTFLKLFWTALISASANNSFEIVKLLLQQKGIDINAKDNIYLF